MRHETEHIAASITDAGDVISRAIRICIVRDLTTLVAVAEDDSFFTPESFERYIVANVIALSVSNWQAQNRTLFQFISKRSVCSLYPHADMFANEMQAAIAYQRSGQKSRFTQNLEPVADAQNESARIRKFLN
jgi:hypothetical protein